jgi:dihydroneopterin aldolase
VSPPSAGPEGDRIELRGLRVLGTHGVLPEERDRPQPLELDLDVWVDMARAAASDALDDTVNYAELATAAADVVATQSFGLLEALAERIATVVLDADARISAVSVSVRKLRPPVALDMATVGVSVLRRSAAGA